MSSPRRYLYEYSESVPEGSIEHDQQICVIVAELGPDEAGINQYQVRFISDNIEAVALENELTETD